MQKDLVLSNLDRMLTTFKQLERANNDEQLSPLELAQIKSDTSHYLKVMKGIIDFVTNAKES